MTDGPDITVAMGSGVLLFDLDGTLVHSLPDLLAALNLLRGELGRGPLSAEQVRRMVGDGAARLVERGFEIDGGVPGEPDFSTLVERFLDLYRARATEETRPFPEVEQTLRGLKRDGWRLAVCTNKPERESHQVLGELRLSAFFETVGGGDSFAERKPAAGHPMGILGRLRAGPSQAVMVGDSRNDVLAARNAGLPVVVVSYGYGRDRAEDLGADRVIDCFSELPAALAGLAGRSRTNG